jgi:hypothetical protein
LLGIGHFGPGLVGARALMMKSCAAGSVSHLQVTLVVNS